MIQTDPQFVPGNCILIRLDINLKKVQDPWDKRQVSEALSKQDPILPGQVSVGNQI